MTTTTTITGDNWIAYNAGGYETARGVQVAEQDETETTCATVSINGTTHRRDELTIADGGRRIDSVHGWYLTRQ